MPAGGQSTFNGNPNTSPATTTPYRPGISDFNGGALADDAQYPPNAQTDPTAALLNTMSAMLVAYGRLVPVLRISVTAGTPPTISQMVAAPDAVNFFNAPAWAATTAYAGNVYVVPDASNGFYYQATVGGTSGGSQPAFPTQLGATVTDGSVTWKCIGTSTLALLRVSAGKVQITWPANSFPTAVTAPTACLNVVLGAHDYSIGCTAITNGIEIDTTQDDVATDLSFTAELW